MTNSAAHGPRRRHLACAITPAGGVPGQSPGLSVSRPPGHRTPRRLHRRWPGVARMGQPRRSGPWPRHTSTAMTAIVGGSSTVPAWLGGGIGPPGRSLSGGRMRAPVRLARHDGQHSLPTIRLQKPIWNRKYTNPLLTFSNTCSTRHFNTFCCWDRICPNSDKYSFPLRHTRHGPL
jgi:hypothetical protein